MRKPKEKTEKRSWIVRVRKEVECEIVTEDCTEEEARTNPGAFEIECNELECLGLKVLSVSPNV